MHQKDLEALAARTETGSTDDPAFVEALLAGLRATDPAAVDPVDVAALVSTEGTLALIEERLPGWRIAVEGRTGHWRATLRESGARDDDEVIGLGRAPTIPLALLAALLRVGQRRARGYV
jgi:hypothetical protein